MTQIYFPVLLDITNPENTIQLRDFLERFDLSLDTIDAAIVIKEDHQIVASCCKLKNVFKMIAVDPEYQHNNLVSLMLNEITYLAFEQGYVHTFIFTPLTSVPIFSSLGYSMVVATHEVALLEKGPILIDETIQTIDHKYQCNKTQNGAIIINGNPFSLGHLHLIETASRQCERLFVFVVEEDVSFFTFEQRFFLIQEGVKHLDNVVVLPSTFYIISQATFPNYFVRDKEHGFDMYATLDVTLFGTWFSKLNITKRFVGEEPLDEMTDAYNMTMAQLLPSYGIELIIIERKHNRYGVISASIIRSLLKAQDWKTLKHYVPDTTYNYLKDNPQIIEKIQTHHGKH